MQPYRVLREMMGDRFYASGETRMLAADDAAHLLALGLVEPIAPVSAPSTVTAPDPKQSVTAQQVRAPRRKTGA